MSVAVRVILVLLAVCGVRSYVLPSYGDNQYVYPMQPMQPMQPMRPMPPMSFDFGPMYPVNFPNVQFPQITVPTSSYPVNPTGTATSHGSSGSGSSASAGGSVSGSGPISVGGQAAVSGTSNGNGPSQSSSSSVTTMHKKAMTDPYAYNAVGYSGPNYMMQYAWGPYVQAQQY